MQIHNKNNPTSKTRLTATDVVKKLIYHCVERGDTIDEIKQSYIGSVRTEYWTSVGGYVDGNKIPNTKIIVEKLYGKTINQTFSLNDIYKEIKKAISAS